MNNELIIDCARKKGAVRALNGVNLGPNLYNNAIPRLNTAERLRALRLPSVRMHDAPLMNAGMRVVDIPFLFPNFAADENDPANYYFQETDDYIQATVDNGSKVYYRLGVSIEHTKKAYKTVPPADSLKWARICANVIRHYNEGWADGFRHDIEYWEIWNEPELNPKMWNAPFATFLEFYCVTASYLKQQFPHLKIGGPSLCAGLNQPADDFLSACQKANAPLDFFSWHMYSPTISGLADTPAAVRKKLDSYGFTNTESHLNEWRYASFDWGMLSADSEYARRHSTFINTSAGAAANLVGLLAWQDAPLDMAHFYLATDYETWGFFDFYGASNQNYYMFLAFERFLATTYRVECTPNRQGEVFADAAIDEKNKSVVLLCANPTLNQETRAIRLHNLKWPMTAAQKIRRIDLANDSLNIVEERTVNPAEGINVLLTPLSVTLIELTFA